MNTTTYFGLLILLPFLASALVYLLGRIGVRRWGSANLARWLSVLALLGEGGLLFLTGQAYLKNQAAVTLTIGAARLTMDGLSLLAIFTLLALSIMVVVFSTSYMKGENNEEKYYALLLAMIGTIIGLSCTRDLFNLWVWFEAMAITSYMLVAFYTWQPSSLEAGIKYLVQSAAGSALVVLGIALVFSQTGTLDLGEIRNSVQSQTSLMMAAGALFLIGFGVKAALVPLHTWLPDAHSQAPSGISAMLSGIVIEAGLVALLRALGGLGLMAATWGNFMLGFGALNMLVGNLMALRQTQVKRLLAFSSVGHMGYMLVGLGVALGYGIEDGAAGAFFHLFTHAMMKGLAFLSVGALMVAFYLSKGDHRALMVDDLKGAARRYPLVAFTLSLAVLSLGGLPPSAGFMSKWQIFAAGFQTQNGWVIGLVIFAALNSVLSLGYYAPLVNRIYRQEPGEVVLKGNPVPGIMSFTLLVMALVIVVLGFYPALMDWVTHPAAQSLLVLFQ